MIPIMALAPYVKKYAGKAVLITVSVVAITGFLAYGYHKIDQGGYDRAVSEYQKRDAETARQGAELLKLKQHEINIKDEAQEKRSMGAIETYANYSSNLYKQLADAKRVQHKSIASSGHRDTMPGTCEDTREPAGSSEEDVQTKLSIKACELLIEEYLVPNAEVIR